MSRIRHNLHFVWESQGELLVANRSKLQLSVPSAGAGSSRW